jgi:hypothetical protein
MKAMGIAVTLVLLSLEGELAEAQPSAKLRKVGVLSAFAGTVAAQAELALSTTSCPLAATCSR